MSFNGRVTYRRGISGGAACVALLAGMMVGSNAGAQPSFGAPVRVGPSFSEPGIDIGADGTIFVNALRGFPSRSPFWRSTDGGASFQEVVIPTPYSRLPGGGDVDVAIGPDGRVYYLDLWVGSNSIVSSRDNGNTWTSGGPFSTLPLTDRQWLTTGGPGRDPGTDRLYVTYQFIQLPSNMMLARSDDSGTTWVHHTMPHLPHQNTLPGQVVADGDFVAASYYSGSRLYLARSFDGGLTWSQSRIDWFGDVRNGAFPAAGLSMDGDTIVASYQSTLGDQINIAVSHDRGATWSLPIRVSDGETANALPWVAVRGDKISVAWYGADRPGDPSSMPSDARWSLRYAESLDGGETVSEQIDVTGPVKAGAVCLEGLTCTGGRELGDFLQVAIHPDGRAMISYADVFLDATQPGVYLAAQLPATL